MDESRREDGRNDREEAWGEGPATLLTILLGLTVFGILGMIAVGVYWNR